MKPTKYLQSLIKVLPGIALFFAMLGTVSAEPNPPGSLTGERQSGPAMIGDLSFDGANMTFIGRCKGADVTLPPLPQPLNLGLADDELIAQIETSRLDINVARTFLPVGCAPPAAVDVIVNTVTKFTNMGSSATASVVLLFVVPEHVR